MVPGGDWSGISILDRNRINEFRWLTLPRVSGKDTKRPDHIFQIFGLVDLPIIFSIESKETLASIENNIGPRLIKYVTRLLSYPPSVSRKKVDQEWNLSKMRLNKNDFCMVSGVAYIFENILNIEKAGKKANSDITFALDFSGGKRKCKIYIGTHTELGKKIGKFINSIDLENSRVDIKLC